MPDEHTLNAVLSSYGLSGLLNQGSFNWWYLLAIVIFGLIGWFAFWHGKKENSARVMLLGIALMGYPYFVSNTILSFAIGLALCAALFFWRE